MQLEVHFKLTAPERLRALKTLNAAHRATDITSIVSSEEGPVDLLSRSWTLLARMRTGLALDALDFRPCPGCGVMMNNSGDHVLCCHKLGIYARHNEIRNELADLCSDLNLHVDVEKGPDGTLLRTADVCMHLLMNHSRSMSAWCTLCNLQSKSRRCNQASRPKRWSNKTSWSAKHCVSATAGDSSPLSSKRSASSAARPSS